MNPLPAVRDAWFFFTHHISAIARLCLPLLLLEAFCQYQLTTHFGEDANPAYAILLGALFYPLYAGPLILFLNARSNGHTPGSMQLLGAGLQLWPAFALLTGLSTLLIAVGLSLLILPGLWVMIRLAFSEPILVLQRVAPLQAMQQSFAMSRGRFLPLFACLTGLLVPLWLLEWWTMPKPGDSLLWILHQAGNGFLQLFVLVVVFRLYMILVTQTPRH